ncbi:MULTISPECIES: hypothetical protein [Acidobacteriaceae]|uniref:hypothetical protein n=1 Tax=Acidobacteriaceae TaxID=204434 RepID=UPI0020B16CA4|nr:MULTISPECIES: hypothetical protein [Acidobacteriaceae]MDW5267664.1 hypothetical protein [Edaphobacter sp.]
MIEYDFKFPAERAAIDKELVTLSSLSSAQITEWFHSFAALSLSSKLEGLDWINRPAQFTEEESAYLWATHQLDAFRKAALDYGDRLRSSLPAEPLPMRRLGIAVIGQGVASFDSPLFRNLRAHGTYFGQVKPDNGLELLLAAVEARAKSQPVSYGHWYVDGGQVVRQTPLLTNVSYQALGPVRDSLLKYMQTEIARPGMGPEELRSGLARLLPTDLGMGKAGDPILDRFQVRVFTEGSGTQIFSTTFAQWTTREALRRAQPLTLLVRYAPRQRQQPMSELLSNPNANPELDPSGSLVDADMAAYYHWINQQRLTGAEQSSFLVWFEGHNQALVIAPSLPRGAQSDSSLDLKELLSLAIS